MQDIDWTQMSVIFNACDNITHLAVLHTDFCSLSHPNGGLFYGNGLSHHPMKRDQDLHLTLFDAPLYYRPNSTPRKFPIFDRVTHIRLKSISFYQPSIGLDRFSRLSHLSVPYCLGGNHKAKDLQHFLDLKSLKMLVITVATDIVKKGRWKRLEKWVRKTRETDGRVYLVERGPIFRDEWELEIRSGDSIWDRALRYTNEWESNMNMKMYG